ncbi:hypothetical protein evm_013292 [Chilo suppressalis]|nr:hypothetical protein evm_013292 [Chilo suppressalis]
MAAEQICEILKDILGSRHGEDLTFCALCLRTETKFTKSKAFAACAKKMRVKTPRNEHLCYMCEAQVSAALHTLHAVTLAAAVNLWCETNAHKIPRTNIKSLKDVLSSVLYNLKIEEEGVWRRVCSRSRLMQTEALLISTDVANATTTASNSEEFRPPETHATMLNVIPSVPPVIDNIVIIDDEEPTRIIALEKLLENQNSKDAVIIPDGDIQQMMLRDPNEQNSFLLYPMMKGQDGNTYVPYLNVKVTGDSLHYVTAGEVAKNTSYHESQREFKENQMYLNGGPVKVKAMELRGSMLVLAGQPNLESSAQPNLGISGQSNLGISRQLSLVIDGQSNLGVSGQASVVIGGESNLRSEPIVVTSENSDLRKRDEVDGCAKHAVMSDKVDWEDKIPMDVISFVDATDPNAEQFLTVEPALDPIATDANTKKHRTYASIRPRIPNMRPNAFTQAFGQLSDEKDLLQPMRGKTGRRYYNKKARFSYENDSDSVIDLC